MSQYQKPDQKFLMEQLARAGADVNIQHAGALWIPATVEGIGWKRLPASAAAKREKLHQKLEEAISAIDSMDEMEREWFSAVRESIAQQERLMSWVVKGSRGGHQEKAHSKLIEALRGFFISNTLPIAISDESPFICLLAHCMRQDPANAKRAALRYYSSPDFQETEEEKAGRETAEAAHAGYVQRLNGWRNQEKE